MDTKEAVKMAKMQPCWIASKKAPSGFFVIHEGRGFAPLTSKEYQDFCRRGGIYMVSFSPGDYRWADYCDMEKTAILMLNAYTAIRRATIAKKTKGQKQ